MVKVAIAGGTGVMGKTLDINTKTSIPHVVVDYNDIEDLVKVLEEHEIHTIISAFGINGTSLSISQANLTKAAESSSVTKRFIPSSFAIKYPVSGTQILPPLQSYFDSLDLLKTTSLEWAVVHNGTFLDYFFPLPSTALDLPEWPRELRIVGETLTFNKLITLAENATGKKFDVKYDSLETLKKSQITELPGHENDYKKYPK
uniref:NmrA-like domain-containing protein n=1 Tax=Bionectria ochroleuca TaxID=29856 RepID=A0A8H7K8P3_BIOOC